MNQDELNILPPALAPEEQTVQEPPEPKKNFFETRTFTIILVTLTSLGALFLAFRIGMFVGYRQASASYDWSANYHQVFGGPQGGFMMIFNKGKQQGLPLPPPMDQFMGQDYMNAHGVFGKVIKVENGDLILDAQNAERRVIILDDTAIRRGRQPASLQDVRINDQAVIIGNTDEKGQIDAKLIRIFP